MICICTQRQVCVFRIERLQHNNGLTEHNANVPVNGDAEYIISMDTDSKILKVLHTGTVEQVRIKKEICDVMEGGEQAFEMRSKRYRQIK